MTPSFPTLRSYIVLNVFDKAKDIRSNQRITNVWIRADRCVLLAPHSGVKPENN